MSTALITGVTGQDGSYLAEQLLAQGMRVVGLHRRLSSANHWRIDHLIGQPGFELRCSDLSDSMSLLRLVDDVQPDEVYNLAAQSFVPTSFDQPMLTTRITGLGFVRLLEAVRQVCPDARIYQASSSEMFGNSPDLPHNEESRFMPASPYACAKLYAHHMARNYREAYGMFVVSGILFNHESPRRGLEFVTRKIAHGVARVECGLQDELILGSLSPRRDWGFAGDYTRAMQLMLRSETPKDYVVASGVDHSVQDFVEHAFAVVGRDWRDHVRTDSELYRRNEVVRLQGDASRVRDELGWEPELDFSGLVRVMVEADLERCRG